MTMATNDTTSMVKICTAGDHARWDTYVHGNPHANRYHLSAWSRIIESTFGHRPYYLLSEEPLTGRVDGVLPIVRLRSRMFGDFMVFLPYVNYGGPAADTATIAHGLVSEAVRLARENRVQHLEDPHRGGR